MRSAYDLETDRTDWRARAACHGEDPELFFSDARDADQAKAVCGRCPVVAECLAWAVSIKAADGVWGGTSEAERAPLLAETRTCSCGEQFVPRMGHQVRCRRCLDLAPKAPRRGLARIPCPVCGKPVAPSWGRIPRHFPPGGRLGDVTCRGSTRAVGPG